MHHRGRSNLYYLPLRYWLSAVAIIMAPPPPNDFLGLSEFNSGFLDDTRVDFAADFDFGANFAAFDIDHDWSGSESPDSVSGLFSGSESPCRRRRSRTRRLRLRRANRHYRIESVKTSCWYLNFLAPGSVCDMTYELSLSDRFGEFRYWFRMPLTKVERLADIFINRDYVQPSRSFLCRGKFHERGHLCAEGWQQNPENHKHTREKTRNAVSNKLFQKVLLCICVCVPDLTKSQPKR